MSADQAIALASACDQDVAIVSKQTPWDTVYATPDGLTRVDTSATAVRTDVNGVWEPIDTTVVPGDGGLEVAAPALEMEFSSGSGQEPLARIVRDGHELTFDVPFELNPPVVDGPQITYPEVLEGVDLVVTVDEDGTGFSEVLRVESPEAAANPALATLSFPVTTSDGLEISPAAGGFEAVDAAGERVFASPTPLPPPLAPRWERGRARVAFCEPPRRQRSAQPHPQRESSSRTSTLFPLGGATRNSTQPILQKSKVGLPTPSARKPQSLGQMASKEPSEWRSTWAEPLEHAARPVSVQS